MVDILPDWPQPDNTLGGGYYLMGDDACANAEFARLVPCDAWLEKSNAPGLAHLERLR